MPISTIMFDEVKTFENLFEAKLQNLYDAEQQLVRALPRMSTAATDPSLRRSIEKHLCETQSQVVRLEQVANGLQLALHGPSCKAMQGLLEESEILLSFNASDEVVDAAIISAAQYIEHYEIAQYGTMVHFARCLGYLAEAEIFGSILAEEKSANETLNQLAHSLANAQALG